MTMTAPTFPQRHALSRRAEVSLATRLRTRGWEVSYDGVERRYPAMTLKALSARGANLCGPDLMAAKNLQYWAIDVKTVLPRREQHLPGMGRYTIDDKALCAMERYRYALFALADEPLWFFITPAQVRGKGKRSRNGDYWFIGAVDAQSLDHVFGSARPGDLDADFPGEYPGDFPLAA